MKKIISLFLICAVVSLATLITPVKAGVPDTDKFYQAALISVAIVGGIIVAINIIGSIRGYSEKEGYIQRESTDLLDINSIEDWYVIHIVSDEAKVFLLPSVTSEIIATYRKGEEKVVLKKIDNTEGRWYTTKVIKQHKE